MPNHWILLPVLSQVLLTLVVYLALNVAKSRALARNEVDLARRALDEDAWPESVRKINNNIRNQLEVPVLFYVVCLALFGLGAATPPVQGLAWLFVATRIGHAWEHTGRNHVPVRRAIFTTGVGVVLVLMGVACYAVVVHPAG